MLFWVEKCTRFERTAVCSFGGGGWTGSCALMHIRIWFYIDIRLVATLGVLPVPSTLQPNGIAAFVAFGQLRQRATGGWPGSVALKTAGTRRRPTVVLLLIALYWATSSTAPPLSASSPSLPAVPSSAASFRFIRLIVQFCRLITSSFSYSCCLMRVCSFFRRVSKAISAFSMRESWSSRNFRSHSSSWLTSFRQTMPRPPGVTYGVDDPLISLVGLLTRYRYATKVAHHCSQAASPKLQLFRTLSSSSQCAGQTPLQRPLPLATTAFENLIHLILRRVDEARINREDGATL
uniref:Uncharacterized protein n=1 Tax=Anopheles atroparvus TaxID=41427 RepID=A0A182IYU2_ANOAO